MADFSRVGKYLRNPRTQHFKENTFFKLVGVNNGGVFISEGIHVCGIQASMELALVLAGAYEPPEGRKERPTAWNGI